MTSTRSTSSVATQYDCLCAGIVVADHVCDPIERLPDAGELVLTRRMDLTIGGCASNVACDLARLGRRAAVCGLVGGDVFGRHVREALAQAGVDVTHLGIVAGCDTAGTLIINCQGQDRRFIHSIGANGRFTGREVTEEMIRSARVLSLGGYCLCDLPAADDVRRMFRWARDSGVPTLLDVVIPGSGDYWPRLAAVLPETDVFFPNDDEGRTITGIADPLQQAEAFHRAGARTVVITCGAKGAVVVSDGVRLRVGVHRVDFRDGTGSGDAFVAGYIEGMLRGLDLEGCLRLGTALGASCVTAIGATTGVFAAAQLDEFLASHRVEITRL